MSEEEAFERVKSALDAVHPGSAEHVSLDTELTQLEQLDSLHLMEMLFELENQLGRKIEAIGEDYSDFRVSALVEILRNA